MYDESEQNFADKKDGNTMFSRILVPLDGSILAERAIPHAEEFARIFNSDIFLLQVLEPTSYHENPQAVDPLTWQIRKAEAEVYMQGIANRIRQNLGEAIHSGGTGMRNRVDYAIREGKTAENIVDCAHAEAIDLLVITTHGSGGLSRWNMSSITQKVVNLIYLPVLIVRAYLQPEAETGRIHYRRILLPIDSSRRAECALPAGIALARGEMPTDMEPEPVIRSLAPARPEASSRKTSLILAAVIKPPELPIPEPHPIEIKQLAEQLMLISHQAAINYLDEMKSRLALSCETCVLENNSAAIAIQNLADQEEDIDLVVLCAHGYSGHTSWPYGSVARTYMEHGTKPVLVIQDVSRSQVQPTAAEIAAEKTGRR